MLGVVGVSGVARGSMGAATTAGVMNGSGVLGVGGVTGVTAVVTEVVTAVEVAPGTADEYDTGGWKNGAGTNASYAKLAAAALEAAGDGRVALAEAAGGGDTGDRGVVGDAVVGGGVAVDDLLRSTGNEQ